MLDFDDLLTGRKGGSLPDDVNDPDPEDDFGEIDDEPLDDEQPDDSGATDVNKAPVDGDDDTFTKVHPDELPDELKPIYKSLQADYTRKTQKLASLTKQIEANAERVRFVEQIEEMVNAGQGAAAAKMLRSIADAYDPPTSKSDTPSATPGSDIDWTIETPATQYLANMVGQIVRYLNSLNGAVSQTSEFVTKAQRDAELAALKAEFGDFDTEALLAEAKKYPQTPLKLVLASMKYPELEANATRKVYDRIKAKRNANPPKSSNATVATKADTFEDAWEQAKRKLRISL